MSVNRKCIGPQEWQDAHRPKNYLPGYHHAVPNPNLNTQSQFGFPLRLDTRRAIVIFLSFVSLLVSF